MGAQIKGTGHLLTPMLKLPNFHVSRWERLNSYAPNTHFCDYFWNPVLVTIKNEA